MKKLIADLTPEETRVLVKAHLPSDDFEEIVSGLILNYSIKFYTEYMGGELKFVVYHPDNTFKLRVYCDTLNEAVGKMAIALKYQSVMIEIE